MPPLTDRLLPAFSPTVLVADRGLSVRLAPHVPATSPHFSPELCCSSRRSLPSERLWLSGSGSGSTATPGCALFPPPASTTPPAQAGMSLCGNWDLRGFCSAALQSGLLDSTTCPPEGGRYTTQNPVATQTLLPGGTLAPSMDHIVGHGHKLSHKSSLWVAALVLSKSEPYAATLEWQKKQGLPPLKAQSNWRAIGS